MFIYLPVLSVLATLLIFRSRGIDYRAVAIGSLLPFVIDTFFGEQKLGHSFFLPCILLAVIMLATMKTSRLFRRRILCFVVGMFWAFVFEGTFRYSSVWFWPIKAGNTQHIDLLPSLNIMLIRDTIGLVALWILFGLGELYKRENRIEFKKTGRIVFDESKSDL